MEEDVRALAIEMSTARPIVGPTCCTVLTTGASPASAWLPLAGLPGATLASLNAELAKLCRRFRLAAHVNLIPLNPTPGWPTRGSSKAHVNEFRDTAW